MANIRPMLAASFDNPQNIEPELQFLTYPMLASPKVDGIRWMKPHGEKVKSRSWKDLPNFYFQEEMSEHWFSCLDGEVIVGNDPASANLFNATQSAIMSRDGTPDFSVWIFDCWMYPNDPFYIRTEKARTTVDIMRNLGLKFVNYLPHVNVNSPSEVLALEEKAMQDGYEGLMLRNPAGTYKFGRSTLKQQGLIKIKRFTDAEGTVVGFEEIQRNQNEPTRDAFGLQKRSSHKAGKVAGGTLGKLILRTQWGDLPVGSGLDDALRDKIWASQGKYLGKVVTFKFQAHGMKDMPRAPIFKGFRSD